MVWQAGGQVLGHAQVAPHMAVAGHQQHRLPGSQRSHRHLGQAAVAGDLNACHGRDLPFGQQAAVAFANLGLLLRQCLGRQPLVQRGVGHGGAHLCARQVAPQHRHARFHRCHHHRAVHRPGPAAVGIVGPLQGLAHLGFAGAAGQTGGLQALFGHFQHQRRQLAALAERLHRGALQRLVLGRIVLFAQQQQGSGGQLLCLNQQGRVGLMGQGGAGAGGQRGAEHGGHGGVLSGPTAPDDSA